MGDAGEWITFRQPFWRWYLAATVIGHALFVLLSAIPATLSGQLGWAYFRTSIPLGGALIPTFMAPAMFLYVRVWAVRVSPHAVRGSNAWGWPVTMSWTSINRVALVPVPALPMARVYSTETRRVLWLPLFVNDFAHFAELVAHYAGDDHPLTVEVVKRLPRDE